MNTFYTILNLVIILLTAGLAIFAVATFRKERRMQANAMLISGLVSLWMLLLFLLISGTSLNTVLGVILFLFGMVVGVLGGSATKLSHKRGYIVGKQSIWFMLVWCGSLVIAQLLNLFESVLASSLGLIPLIFSCGTQVGISGFLFLRCLMMKPNPKPASHV